MIDIATMHFLVDLSLNNSKQWFDEHRKEYDLAKLNFIEFVQHVIDMHGVNDKAIRDIKAKDCLFRINRDVRFSNNKSPYKTNFGASISIGGKKAMRNAGYYFHLEPDNAFMGGGLYGPDVDVLNIMRNAISKDLSTFEKIVKAPKFKAIYVGLNDNDEYSLKRVPKGFDDADPAAAYLKLKGYVAMAKMEDQDLLSKDAVKKTVESFKALQPLIEYINQAVIV